MTVDESIRVLRESFTPAWWDDCGIPLSTYETANRPAVVQYEIVSVGTWSALVGTTSATCELLPGAWRDGPDLRLELPEHAWLDIIHGRSSPWRLLASGALRAEGDRDLLGPLHLLGLLGPVVRPDDVRPADYPWVASAPYWVLPRILTADGADHEKWRYFTQLGDLQVAVGAPTALPRLIGTRKYFSVLRFLWPSFWRRSLLIAMPITWGLLLLLAIVMSARVDLWLLPSFVIVLVVAYVSMLFTTAILFNSGDHADRVAERMLTKMAWEDPEFFHWALDRGLMRIRMFTSGFK